MREASAGGTFPGRWGLLAIIELDNLDWQRRSGIRPSPDGQRPSKRAVNIDVTCRWGFAAELESTETRV